MYILELVGQQEKSCLGHTLHRW